VIVDKRYGSNALIGLIDGNNSEAIIPSKKNRKTPRE
jgi:hypothetical protein